MQPKWKKNIYQRKNKYTPFSPTKKTSPLKVSVVDRLPSPTFRGQNVARKVPSVARGIYERLAIYSQSQLCVSTNPALLTLEAGEFNSTRNRSKLGMGVSKHHVFTPRNTLGEKVRVSGGILMFFFLKFRDMTYYREYFQCQKMSISIPRTKSYMKNSEMIWCKLSRPNCRLVTDPGREVWIYPCLPPRTQDASHPPKPSICGWETPCAARVRP